MGLENLSVWHVIAIVLVGLFVFGPDRLPTAIGDGLRMLRQVRRMARNATSDLSRELGTDISIDDLNPKALLRKHLLTEADEAALRAPLDGLLQDLRTTASALDPTIPTPRAVPSPPADDPTRYSEVT